MTEQERNTLENLGRKVQMLPEFERGHLLGYTECMADMKKKKEGEKNVNDS